MKKQQIVTKNAPHPAGPYSQGITYGDLVFVAGQRPANPDTNDIVDGGIREQTEQCIKNIQSVLEASGSSLADVLSSRVYLADINDFNSMNSVYETMFPQPYPVRTTISCTLRNILIEIDVIAVKKSK